MENYCSFESTFFDTNEIEIAKLPDAWTTREENYNEILDKVRSKYWDDIDYVNFKALPFKKSTRDVGVLLVIRRGHGTYKAKRYKLNQWLRLDYK